MHVVFKVLASTSIKRRKPWPRLAWIGKERQNLLLLGDRRVSILYMPSGKTKRKISKLHSLIKDCVSLTYTSNGLYLIGLLTSGNIFVWCKDNDLVSHIRGLVDLQARSQITYKWRPKLFSSNDGNALLVVVVGVLTTEIYLYQCKRDFEQSTNTSIEESNEAWWRCGTDMEVTPLRSRVGKEMTLDVRFVTDNVFGRCCFVAFVYSCESSIQLVTLVIRWFPNNALPVHDWHKMALPYVQLSVDAKPVAKRGAFVMRWSHDGRLLAIAVNQETTDQDTLVFVSPFCKVLYIATLPYEYSGLRRHRWIRDICWTRNDLFVITINQLGSICLLSRLGEPLSIATSGCSMDLPVSLSLNIHPFIFVRPHTTADNNSSTATTDILKQQYSICCHPFLPFFLCSDGYMVTCLQFPQQLVNPFRFIDVCFHQSEKYLRVMRKCLRLADATMDLTEDYPLLTSNLHKSAIHVRDFEVYNGLGVDPCEMLPTESETLSESDSSNLKSEQVLHHYSIIGKHESGTLVFGAQDTDGSQFRSADSKSKAFSLHQLLNDAKKETGSSLLSIWGILVTASDIWTTEWEERAKKASDLLVKVCSEFLSASPKSKTEETVDLESSFLSVILLITNLMNLCRFSALNKSIMPILLSSIFAIFCILLKCAENLPLPVHALHLVQFCNLLESTEKIFSDVFGTMVNQLLYFSPQNNLKNAFFINGPQSKTTIRKKSTLQNRFTSTWILLYKASVKLIRNCSEGNDNCIILLGRLQRKLQNLNIDLNLKKRHHKVDNAEKVLICDPSKYENAAEQWKLQVEASLEGTTDKSRKTSVCLLHSILYALLGGYHLKDAISLIYWLLTRESANHIESDLRHPAIRQTIRSFARFMAAYFVDKQLHVFPYHRPRYFPSLNRHCNSQMSHRILPVCRVKLTQSLNDQRMAYHWTADVTIALFLSSGYIREVAGFVHRLGDWKTALVLFYASQIARESKSSKMMSHRILESQLIFLTKSLSSSQPTLRRSPQRMTSSFQNGFLAGALCDIDVVTSVLDHQMQELQNLVRQLPLIVPTDVYLPHPPPYCPQPGEQNHCPAESLEEKLRYQIARHIQFFIVVLQTLQCTAHFIDIYLSDLSSLAKKVALAKELTYEDWPLLDLFLKLKHNLSEFQQLQPEQRQRLGSLACYFRDFCATCWFLHVRDKMNMHLRKFWQQLMKSSAMPAKFCLNALRWAVHLIPFAETVGWNLDVYHVIISILLEAPRDRRSSLILAQCFPDMAQIPTELDYRISSLLNVWRSTVIKVPSNRRQPRTAKTLSVIHLSQCDGVRNTLTNLKGILGNFDSNVLNSRQTVNYANFKARIFEIEKDYFSFLRLMFDVGIIKDTLEDDAAQAGIPLLNVFKDMLQQQYLVRPALADKDRIQDKDIKRNAIHEIFVDAQTLKNIKSQLVPSSNLNSDLRCKKSTLFRSFSLTELNHTRVTETSGHPLSSRVKSLGNLSKSSVRRKSKDTTQILPKCSSLLALCDAIDVDQSWTKSPRYVQMLEVLSWLVKWTKREDYAGSLTEENANMPRMKVQITFSQLVAAIQQAVNHSLKQKQIISSSIIAQRDNIPLPEYNLLCKTPAKSGKLPKTICDKGSFLQGDDLELVKQSETITTDKKQSLAFHRNWSETSKEGQMEVNTLTSDNSFSSLDSDINLTPDAARVSDDLMSATTSRWTNSSQFPEISSKPKEIRPPVKRVSPNQCNYTQGISNEPPSTMLPSLSVTSQASLLPSTFRTPQPRAASTKDFTCGDGLIWGAHLIDTCIQVNVKSLAEMPIQPTEDNGQVNEIEPTSTCDDTQNDACSLPITTSVSFSEEPSLRKKLPTPREKRCGHAHIDQPMSEQETECSNISVVKANVTENKKTNITHIRLLRLPAEKELCAMKTAEQTSTITGNARRIPVLLHLDPECKLVQKIVQSNAQSQPKMLSHQEIQHLQSKFQCAGKSSLPDTPASKGNPRKYSVPPLLQLDSSSASKLPLSLPQQKIRLGANSQAAIPKTSLNVLATDKLRTQSQGVQTVAEREHFSTASNELTPKRLAIASQGVRAKAQREHNATTSSPQTLPVKIKHISTSTDNLQRQHASTLTDAPRSVESIGINTSVQDEFPLDEFSVKYPTEKPGQATEKNFLVTLSVAQATQTEEPTRREETKQIDTYTGVELRTEDNVDRTTPASELIMEQKRKSIIQNDLDEHVITSQKRPGEKTVENMVDLKMMRERLSRLQKEGLLNEDTCSVKVKSQLQLDKSTPASINTQCVNTLPIRSYLPKRPGKEPDVRAKLTQSSLQQKELKDQRENFRYSEKVPFVHDDLNVTKIDIGRTEQQRKKRQYQMHSDHYEARKNEAVRLMQELVQDQEACVAQRIVKLRRSQPVVNKPCNASNFGSPSTKQDNQDDPSATYTLSRGLIPLKGISGACPRSLPASPSRKKIVSKNFVSCPTSPKTPKARMRQTTYIERLQALQPPRIKNECYPVKSLKAQDQLEATFLQSSVPQTPPDFSTSSDTSSNETLSPWIVPDEVQRLLASI